MVEVEDYSESGDFEEEDEFETIDIEYCQYKITKKKNAILAKVNKIPTTPTQLTIPAYIEANGAQYDVTKIGPRALRDSKIKSLSFAPDSKIETLSKDSLYCHTLEDLTIPPKLTTLEKGWCNFTLKLIKISVPEENDNFKTVDDKVLYSSNMSVLYFVNRNVRTFVVPNTVKTIYAYAFEQCRRLKNFSFEDEPILSKIEPWAFSHCGLKTIHFPSSLVTISYDSFFHTHSLKEISFDKDAKIKEILISAFKDTRLSQVVLPESCKKIAIASFQNIPTLTEVRFESRDFVIVWRDAFKGANSDFKVVAYEGLEFKGTGASSLNIQRISADDINTNLEDDNDHIDENEQGI